MKPNEGREPLMDHPKSRFTATGMGRFCLRYGIFSLFLAIGAFCFSFPALAADWSPLMKRLINDGFEEKSVRDLFSRDDVQFDPEPMATKMNELLRLSPHYSVSSKQYMSREVHKRFLRSDMINKARVYLERNRATLEQISRTYCVPKEVVVSILLVETHLGANTGKRKAFHVLSSMALSTDFEQVRTLVPARLIRNDNEEYARTRCREKADWAYNELKHLLEYSRINKTDPLSIPGSIYGAIGLCQFMPSNVFLYGVDADGKGGIDLFSTPDALNSIANYLHQNGWGCRIERKNRRQVVMTYNKSQVYANTVLAVADRLQAKKREKGRSNRAT
jgi:membrane-bound lytic murein transglycosylase B